jgi:LPS O-antigen subunit length determinant protein (WzzB/FepE family)
MCTKEYLEEVVDKIIQKLKVEIINDLKRELTNNVKLKTKFLQTEILELRG